MYRISIISFLLLVSLAIGPRITAQSTFAVFHGGIDSDQFSAIEQTKDGGYIVAGKFNEVILTYDDMWVTKLNSQGNAVWSTKLGGDFADEAFSVAQTTDGGYIVAGTTDGRGGNIDGWLVRLNGAGKSLWQRKFGTASRTDWLYSVKQTKDGGYIAAGQTYSYGAGDADAWVIKLSKSGGVQWQKTYGGRDFDNARAIVPTADGGYVVVGSYESEKDTLRGNGWVFKLDATGRILWQREIGTSKDESPVSVAQALDGSYCIAGGVAENYAMSSLTSNGWVLKLDANGNTLWQKLLGGSRFDFFRSVAATQDGGCAVAGVTQSFGATGDDIYVVRMSSSGAVMWQKRYGKSFLDSAYGIAATTDGGFAVAGSGYGMVSTDGLVIKLDANGNTCGSFYRNQTGQAKAATFPNLPTNAIVTSVSAAPKPTNVRAFPTTQSAQSVCSQ